jgi:hypothetical protein
MVVTKIVKLLSVNKEIHEQIEKVTHKAMNSENHSKPLLDQTTE